MTKKEAIMAMLEGKKVRKTDWKSKAFIYFNEDYNMVDDKNCMCSFDGVSNEENWEEYIDYVAWNIAYEHMLKGGTAWSQGLYRIEKGILKVKFGHGTWQESTVKFNEAARAKWKLLEE